MKVCICGAGVAGPTLAFWLKRAGHHPTLVEAAPQLRTGGYMIDFWGVGYSVAERMGILPQVHAAGYELVAARFVDGGGRDVGVIPGEAMRRELAGRFVSLPRGDLAAIVYTALEKEVETLFGVSIASLTLGSEDVRVRLSSGEERLFDLVVGADGLHSKVRGLVFGPQAAFERRLGYYAAAFELEGYAPRDELAYVSHARPGRQISRFAQRDGRTTFLLVFAAERLNGPEPNGLGARKAALARVFDGVGWEWPRIAGALQAVDDIYFDRVSQISAPSWRRDRVALVGDAAACVSLLAGEGTGLGMTEAYVLAGELARCEGPCDDLRGALLRYESRLRRFVDGKQKAAASFAGAFTPRTSFGIWLRNQSVKLMAIPGAANLFVGPQLRDDFDLPDYGL
jgi:2-polyprenyl-6-methoxyphenol hydroxylase-like FAD-dependent oxidoreductase